MVGWYGESGERKVEKVGMRRGTRSVCSTSFQCGERDERRVVLVSILLIALLFANDRSRVPLRATCSPRTLTRGGLLSVVSCSRTVSVSVMSRWINQPRGRRHPSELSGLWATGCAFLCMTAVAYTWAVVRNDRREESPILDSGMCLPRMRLSPKVDHVGEGGRVGCCVKRSG